jgi:hypothetical protein
MRRFDDVEPNVDSVWSRGGAGHSSELTRERVPYQYALRALGAYLDERRANSINLLEAEGGFAVRYQPQRNLPDTVLVRVEYPELKELSAELERRRRRKSFPFGSKESAGPNSYENVLRALGYELDEVQAYSILIDEIDDGMVITYQYLSPHEGFNARKRMVILGSDAMQAVLQDAEARREHRKHGILSLLAS